MKVKVDFPLVNAGTKKIKIPKTEKMRNFKKLQPSKDCFCTLTPPRIFVITRTLCPIFAICCMIALKFIKVNQFFVVLAVVVGGCWLADWRMRFSPEG